MPQYVYVLSIAVLLIGVAGTIAVGLSKENKEENSEYSRRTKKNIKRLTLYYVITGIFWFIAVAAFIWML